MSGRSRHLVGRQAEFRLGLLLLVVGAAASCALETQPPPAAGTGGSSAGITVSGSGGSKVSGTGGKTSIVIGSGGKTSSGPILTHDTRQVVTQERRPPPISGGTLLALRDGQRAVVADPDRDRVLIVNFVTREVEAVFQLEAGAEPGRVVEGADGRAFVVLRGAGEVLTVDVAALSLGERRAVCQAPRGLVHDPERDSLLVACAEGQLVELPAAASEPTQVQPIGVDARDVVLRNGALAMTRFRSAEILLSDSGGNWVKQSIPSSSSQGLMFAPEVAWRMVVTAEQELVIAHQRVTTESLIVSEGNGLGAAGAGGEAGFFGGFGSSSYGTEAGCGGVVQTVVSRFLSDGTVATSLQLSGIVLPVDVAVSAKDGTVAVANAGRVDGELSALTTTSVGIYSKSVLEQKVGASKSGCLPPTFTLGNQAPAIAVAFDPQNGLLLAQTREPAQLVTYDLSSRIETTIALDGSSVLDTGHEIFHRDSGAGVACASCHPEGTDDGRVWSFSPLGLRRTQPLDVGLEGSEPFHWGGELADFDALMTEVFNVRMSGPTEIPERLAALKSYIFSLTPRPGIRAADDPAALRGKALFESEAALCSSCHAGEKKTSAVSVDIGKGRLSQVPSLLGVSRRPPFMSDGCAASLLDRFDPTCGGAQHGNTAQLSPDEVSDLVAYLESL